MARDPSDRESLEFPSDVRALLDRYGFDQPTFVELRARYKQDPVAFANTVVGHLTPPASDDLKALPPRDSSEIARLADIGRGAIARGQLAVVVLAGGMATRFGGTVKAAVAAVAGRSFLDLKLADVEQTARDCGASIDVFVMTSFTTDDLIRQLLASREASLGPGPRAFAQFISVRLAPNGDIFCEPDGRPSLYAPGHGDLIFALRRSGLLAAFLARGGRYLFISNVDNLAATCDPAILGAHIESGAAITAEVVDKQPGDRGGAPARLEGRPQIIEEFRFPAAFDQASIPVFNTNTFVFDAQSVDRDEADLRFDWFAARKRVGDAETVQFERLIGQITALLPSAFLHVPRGGVAGRFLPVKDPGELAARQAEIHAVLASRGLVVGL